MKILLISFLFFLPSAHAIRVNLNDSVVVTCTVPHNMMVEHSAQVNGILSVVGSNPNGSDSLEGTLDVVLGSEVHPDFSQKNINVQAVRMPNNSIQAFAMNAGLSMIYIDGNSSYVEIGNKSYKSFCVVVSL